jgi:hypothetical protein
MLLSLNISSVHKLVYKFSEKDESGYTVGDIGFVYNNSIRLKYDTWAWFLGEHINMVIFAVIIILPGRVKLVCGSVFLLIHIVDLASFILVYDDPFKSITLTWNVSKVIIFGFSMWYAMQSKSNVSE